MASEATPLLSGSADASTSSLPAVLSAIDGIDGPVIDGEAVKARLRYTNLLDLLPATESAVIHGTDGRLSMSHKRLAAFIEKDFDLTPWGMGPGDRAAVVLPNGPETAACVLSVAAHCTCAPINHQNTAEEIELEMSNVQSKVCLIMDGVDNAHVVEAATSLGLPIIKLVADAEHVGVFKLEGEPTQGARRRRRRRRTRRATAGCVRPRRLLRRLPHCDPGRPPSRRARRW